MMDKEYHDAIKRLNNAQAVLTDQVKERMVDHIVDIARREEDKQFQEYRARMKASVNTAAVNPDDPRLNIPIEFWENKRIKYALRDIGNSHPTDELILNAKVADELGELWMFKDTKFSEFRGELVIPSDLVMARTIPAYDEIIGMEMNDDKHHFASIKNCRIIIDKHKLVGLKEIEEGQLRVIGYLILKFFGNFELIYSIMVTGDAKEKLFLSMDVGYKGELPKQGYFPSFVILRIAKTYLSIWYGSMLALLHPVIKEKIMEGEPAERYARPYEKRRVRKHSVDKVHHVRTRYIREGIISGNRHAKGESSDDHAKYSRHTPYWHVSGHFRKNPRTGKDEFISGYWKGPQRDLIINGMVEPEIRSRELEVVKPPKKQKKSK